MKIILASGSETRAKQLREAGLSFDIVKPDLDEDELKKQYQDLGFVELGLLLAKAKAIDISKQYPDAYVIAADQICVLDGKIFDKPMKHSICVEHLKKLSGQTHQQYCQAVIYHQGQLLRELTGLAKLTMRNLSEEEILAYIDLDQPFYSCGSYMFEKNGHKLFSQVIGSKDIILGLPLEEIMIYLSNQGLI